MALLRKCLQELRDRCSDDAASDVFMTSTEAERWQLVQMSLAFAEGPRMEIGFMAIPGAGAESSYGWVLEH